MVAGGLTKTTFEPLAGVRRECRQFHVAQGSIRTAKSLLEKSKQISVLLLKTVAGSTHEQMKTPLDGFPEREGTVQARASEVGGSFTCNHHRNHWVLVTTAVASPVLETI